MKPSTIAFIAAAGLGLGLSGRALWQTANPPAPEEAYVQLFQDHCLSRLADVQSGSDPFGDLPRNGQRITRLDTAGLHAIQKHDRCEVKDATRLMTATQRDAAVSAIVSLIASELPQLSENGDPLDWDLYRAFTTVAPKGSPERWGVLVLRQSADSADALQATVTTLVLPRS